jgi:hypothetical protein
MNSANPESHTEYHLGSSIEYQLCGQDKDVRSRSLIHAYREDQPSNMRTQTHPESNRYETRNSAIASTEYAPVHVTIKSSPLKAVCTSARYTVLRTDVKGLSEAIYQ